MQAPNTKIALQLYTLRDYLKTPEQIAESLKRVREIGYQAVQVSGMGPIEPGHLREILDGNELFCCATHVGLKGLRHSLPDLIAYNKTLGCDFTALGHPSEKSYFTPAGSKQLVADLQSWGEQFKAAGIRFGYHNHALEFEHFNGQPLLAQIYEQTAPDTLWAELDTYWVQYGGGDPVWWINKVAGRMPVVHFKDMTIISDSIKMAEVGSGNLNWPAIIAACAQTGVRWYAVEQDSCQGDPWESVALSFKNLKDMGVE
jgi:sugar phosphate isomerase/epimerase